MDCVLDKELLLIFLFGKDVTDYSEAVPSKKIILSFFNSTPMEMFNLPNWYIAHTIPLQERRAIEKFCKLRIEHYCPMNTLNGQYFGNKKTMNVPLFPSYVFVYVTPVEHSGIKKIWEVVNLVHWLDKPVIIEMTEIEMLKKFLSLYTDIMVEKIPLCRNSVISGRYSSFSKDEAMSQEVSNGFLRLPLPSIGYELKTIVRQEFKTSINTLSQKTVSNHL